MSLERSGNGQQKTEGAIHGMDMLIKSMIEGKNDRVCRIKYYSVREMCNIIISCYLELLKKCHTTIKFTGGQILYDSAPPKKIQRRDKSLKLGQGLKLEGQ